ncbi:MAG: hypothetical protein PHQ52_03140 [Candidatus Omnitrophica bacterium]|nr:hypothetical protein [Candidatus Omnitrophota bacterium]
MNPRLKQAYSAIEYKWENTPYEVCNELCFACERDIQKRCELFQKNMEEQLEDMLKGKETDIPKEPCSSLDYYRADISILIAEKPLICRALTAKVHYYWDKYNETLSQLIPFTMKDETKDIIANGLLYSVGMSKLAHMVGELYANRQVRGSIEKNKEAFVKYYLLLKKEIRASELCLKILSKELSDHKYRFYQLIKELRGVRFSLDELEKEW